jgi:hypothetical protein
MELLPIVSKEKSRRAHQALPAQNQEATPDGLAAEPQRQPEGLRPDDVYGAQR